MANYSFKNKLPLLITFAVTALGLYLLFYSIITPDIYKNLNPKYSIGFIFIPDYDEYEGHNHLLFITIFPFSKENIISAKGYYKKKHEEAFNSIPLQRISQGNNWVGELPTLKRGERFFYFLEIIYLKDNQRSVIRIPHWAPNKPLLYVTYEGKPSKFLLLTHIVLVVASALFLIHSFYFALTYLINNNSSLLFRKIYSSVFWAWVLFAFSTIFLGYFVAKAAFGKGWNGIPIGDDITDNKSLFTAIFWGILLILTKKELITERKFCFWVIIGIIITTIVYLIPHSYFFQ